MDRKRRCPAEGDVSGARWAGEDGQDKAAAEERRTCINLVRG